MRTTHQNHLPKALIFIFTALLLLSPLVAKAVTISPKVLDLEMQKRDIVNKTITLTNNGSRQVRLYAYVNEISVDEDGEIKDFVQPLDTDRTETVTSWIEVSRGRITIPPGGTHELPIKIQIHPEAKAGDYHAFVAIVNASNKDEAKKRALAGTAPGLVVSIELDKERTEFFKLSKFVVDRFVLGDTTDTVTYTLNNDGQAELVPRGEVIFYNSKGNEVGAIPINPDGQEIQGGEEKEFIASVPPDIGAGKYKAFLSMQYGTDQIASLTDTTFFYMMPIQTMIIIFVSVLAFALILTVVIYHRMNEAVVHPEAQSVSMYRREGVSEAFDHDIDLKPKANPGEEFGLTAETENDETNEEQKTE